MVNFYIRSYRNQEEELKCYHHGNKNERHRGVDRVLRGEKKDLKKEETNRERQQRMKEIKPVSAVWTLDMNPLPHQRKTG